MSTLPASAVGVWPFWPTLLAVVAASVASGAPPKEHFHLFLLMGQSNMALSMPLAAADRDVADRIRVFDPAGGGTWHVAVGDDPAKPPSFPVGPGLGFAAEAARGDPGLTIGLVPLAVGGSGLASWEKDAANYQRALELAARVRQDGTLKAVLWHQGETDAYHTTANPGSYGPRLVNMIGDLRHDLGSNDLPFIAGQIGPWVARKRSFTFVPLINQALTSLPSQVAGTACVSSEGLAHGGDNLHFSELAEQAFGRRYAEAYARLTAETAAAARP